MLRLRRSLTLVLALALVSSRGHAAGREGEPAGVAKGSKVRDALTGPARDAFDRASLLFRAGSFSAARVEFDQAYRESGERRVLYNVAVCDKELHHYARAVAALKESLGGGEPLTEEYRKRVDETLALLEPLTTVLTVTTEPGARIALDDEPLGVAPLPEPLPVDVGEHVVVVRKDGFLEGRTTLAAASGIPAHVELPLTAILPVAVLREAPASASARIRVSSADPNARVFVDDNFIGQGTLEQQVPIGSHRIRVERRGERTEVTDLTLNANEMRTVTVDTSSQLPAWLWVVGGVAVVAAVTTLVIVGRTNETRFEGSAPGTLPPRIVAASF